MKIIVVASLAYSLVNFRASLLSALVRAGNEVIACAPENDPEVEAALRGMGVRYKSIPMQRAAVSPLTDLATLRSLARLLREERADIVLAYTQKPIIYAGLASRLMHGPRFFAMVSGLGHAFTDHGGANPLLRRIVSGLYRVAIARASAVFIFNRDDKAEMRRAGILSPRHKVVQVPGSGIDLARFPEKPVPSGPPIFLLVARLLRNKGLPEFVEAARHIRRMHPEARFQLLGPLDANPSGISKAQLHSWLAEGVVEYLGETRDVRPFLAAASVFVLPTWYREGLPRTILEAMATGRPIITTDAPGCRETVVHGDNGFLVPVRDPGALMSAMLPFIHEPVLAQQMGKRSRQMAESHFAVERVNELILGAMEVTGGEGRIAGKAAADSPSPSWPRPERA